MFILILLLEAGLLAALSAAAVVGFFEQVWLVWALVALDFLLMLWQISRRLRRRKKGRESKQKDPLPHVDETFDMSGADFEQYIAELYRRLGKKAVVTGKSRDQGIDIIVGRIFRTGIQAKCYHRPVGNKAVQEAAAGRKYYRLGRSAVITNSIFSDSAKALAKKNKVKLIDRRALAAMVKKANAR